MLQSVKNTIKRYNMINGAAEITVALSGGADSVAMLLCLLELKTELGVNISAAHLNHCLRGAESDADERYVRELCNGLGVELTVERADITAESEKTHESIELCARRVRYAFLERVSKGLIATAHTANDNIETVLHNLARGTGSAGLCGIPPVRGRIIRPLISVTRHEVEEFCAAKGVKFCVDSTNADENYTRNFIRRLVVPKLLEINSCAVQNTVNMSAALRDDADFLNKTANSEYVRICDGNALKSDELNKLHPAIRSRCIAMLYKQTVGRTPEHRHIDAVTELLVCGGRCSVQNDFSAVVKDGLLRFLPSKSVGTIPETPVDGLPFDCFGVEIFKISKENLISQQKFNSLLLNNAVDCDKICGKLILRSRKQGDEIKFLKRNCTKSLKKLFQEAKIDEVLRDSIPVLADEKGPVWVSGFGVAERCSIDKDSENIAVVRENK